LIIQHSGPTERKSDRGLFDCDALGTTAD